MNEKSELRKKLGGLTSREILIPLFIAFVIIHVIIITSFLGANILSNQLGETQRRYTDYVSEANSVIGGSSMMSETCTNFVLAPVDGEGNINVGPLLAFAGEDRDVADPWYTGDFEATFRDVRLGCTAILNELRKRRRS